jgi:hypothetical protein
MDPAADSVGSDVTGSIDLADYFLPSCDHAGPSWATSDGQRRRIIPMGMDGGQGRIFIAKGGGGYEEWSIDASWIRIRRDTTWSHDEPGKQWPCDVVCGKVNYSQTCLQRWKGDQANFALTLYTDTNGNVGAPLYPRRVNDKQSYTASYDIVGQSIASCTQCDTNFTGKNVGHTVTFKKIGAWQGFADVLEIHVTGGVGGGEHYFYGRGQGWIGFQNINGHEEHVVPTGENVTASALCSGGASESSICAAVGSKPAQPPPPPTSTGTQPPPNPPPVSWDCSKSAHAGKQYWTCSNGNLYRCQNGQPQVTSCTNGCEVHALGTDDACKAGAQPPPPPPPPPPPASCACRQGVGNYCLYGPKAVGCSMTFPGGYCDPNGDGSFADADWVRGYNENHKDCP